MSSEGRIGWLLVWFVVEGKWESRVGCWWRENLTVVFGLKGG